MFIEVTLREIWRMKVVWLGLSQPVSLLLVIIASSF